MKLLRNKRWLLPLAAALLFTGCGQNKPVNANLGDVSIRETVTQADPGAAIQEIYSLLPDSRTEELSTEQFSELFPGAAGMAEEIYGRISDVSGGLADVVIVKPKEGAADDGKPYRDSVWDSLRLYQDKRIREFENYDILDAFPIAKNAEVYSQGSYIIFLMLPDNEAAREIVDRHIPL